MMDQRRYLNEIGSLFPFLSRKGICNEGRIVKTPLKNISISRFRDFREESSNFQNKNSHLI